MRGRRGTRTPHDRPYQVLGQRLAELRHTLGLSQRGLARTLGLSDKWAVQTEGGYVRPSPENLQKVAELAGTEYLPLAELAGYVPPQTKESGDGTDGTPRRAEATAGTSVHG